MCVRRLKGRNLRPRRRWEDNIKMGHAYVWYEGVGSVRVLQNREQWRAFVKTLMKLQVQQEKMHFSIT
jgi:hypothetical protein